MTQRRITDSIVIANQMAFAVVVSSLAGQSCHVIAGEDWTVRDVKSAVQYEMAVPSQEQKLVCGEMELDDSDLMAALQLSSHNDPLNITMLRITKELAQWIKKLRCSSHYSVFRQAPEHIQSERDAVLAAIHGDANVIYHISEEFTHDRTIVLAAVQKDAEIFRDVSQEFHGDRRITLLAVEQNGRNLEFASDDLKRDREVVSIAIKTYARALLLCPKERWDVDLVLDAIKSSRETDKRSAHHCFLQNVLIQDVLTNRDFVEAALEKDPLVLRLSPEFKADRELVSRAVELSWKALEHVAEELKSDKGLVSKAIAQNPLALQFACSSIRGDTGMVIDAIRRNPSVLMYASKELRDDPILQAHALAGQSAILCNARCLEASC